MVGILVSFWDGLLSGAMLVSGSVLPFLELAEVAIMTQPPTISGPSLVALYCGGAWIDGLMGQRNPIHVTFDCGAQIFWKLDFFPTTTQEKILPVQFSRYYSVGFPVPWIQYISRIPRHLLENLLEKCAPFNFPKGCCSYAPSSIFKKTNTPARKIQKKTTRPLRPLRVGYMTHWFLNFHSPKVASHKVENS